MKLIQFAVASIVDANTGYQGVQDYHRIDYATEASKARVIRSKSFSDSFKYLGQAINYITERYQSYREAKINLKRLNGLNDYLLADIGLDRVDLRQVSDGLIDLETLNKRRESRLNHDIAVPGIATGQVAEKRSAANKETFKAAQCA